MNISCEKEYEVKIAKLERIIETLEQDYILDKINTDIQELHCYSYGCSDGIIDDVENIIDNYKTKNGK